MKLRRFIIIGLLVLVILAVIYSAFQFNFNKKDYAETVRNVTKNTKLADINLNHNQALDVMDYANSRKIESPDVLINFDTHSDVILNFPIVNLEMAGIESWIPELVAQNPSIKEIYWVMPDIEAQQLNLQVYLAGDDFYYIENNYPIILYGNSIKSEIHYWHFLKDPIHKKAYTQSFLINPKTEMMNEIPEDNELYNRLFANKKDFREVKITTCTLNTLPDLSGKKVFLSIDADYTSNSGFDTVEGFKFIKSKKEIYHTFNRIFKTLEAKNADIRIMSLTISPQYLPEHLHAYLEERFEEILLLANKMDVIDTYKRRYIPENEFAKLLVGD